MRMPPLAKMGIANSWDFLREAEEEFHVRRLFGGLEGQDKPEDNWGMRGIEMPQWVLDAHNTKSGRIFMFGSGPSLYNQRPLLRKLNGTDTWTVNRFRKFRPPFIPTYHGVTEPGPIGHWGEYILQVYDFPEAQNRIAVNWWPLNNIPGWKWVPKAPDEYQVRWEGWFGLGDYLPPIPTAWASPLTFGQLACWFGYDELIYLGVDTTQEGQAWAPETGRTMQPRAIHSILECADRARIQIERAGRRIIDCTPGGRLNEEQGGPLPYVPLSEVLL
jgi:hypothetical protein